MVCTELFFIFNGNTEWKWQHKSSTCGLPGRIFAHLYCRAHDDYHYSSRKVGCFDQKSLPILSCGIGSELVTE